MLRFTRRGEHERLEGEEGKEVNRKGSKRGGKEKELKRRCSKEESDRITFS